MKTAALAAVLALLLPCAAAAEDSPEAVYGKYHQALRAGKIAEAKKYATAAGMKQNRALLPQSYDIWNTDAAADGKSLTLRATGKGANLPGGKPETKSGVILMRKDGGGWKVEQADWQGANQPGLALEKSVKAPAPAPDPTAPVIGVAREPCVYKPVMTSVDMERCR